MQHFANRIALIEQRRGTANVIQHSLRQQGVGFHFFARALSYAEKLDVVARVLASIALCNVCWNGRSSSSDLRRQAKQLIPWEGLGETIGFFGHEHGFTPNPQITI
jgi:hypothetical protein